MTDKTPWTVTQADREAAASVQVGFRRTQQAILTGDHDHTDLVQAFARHRHESQVELVEALKLALEYWAYRQQRYKNRSPVWVQCARKALAKLEARP